MALDRPHVRGDLREYGRVVARAGADVEHALAAAQVQQRDHVGDERWLADRLARADGQRAVLPRALAQVGGNEQLAGDARDSLDHELVEAAPAQGAKELLAFHVPFATPDSVPAHSGRPAI